MRMQISGVVGRRQVLQSTDTLKMGYAGDSQ